MATIVKGHGSLPGDDQDTFVPLGTTVKFYSDFDVNLGTTVALIAIRDGASAPPKETIRGSGTIGDIANYALWEQDDGFIAKWLAMGGEAGIPIKWVGGAGDIPDGTRLCSKPGVCTGTHTCDGVLGKVQDTEIIILACRGFEPDQKQKSEYAYGSDEEHPLHDLDAEIDKYVDKILTLAKSDPAAAEAQADELPQGTIALMINRLDYDAWQKARFLKDLAERKDYAGIVGHITANASSATRMMNWLKDIPSYGDALDTAALEGGQAWAAALNNASDAVKDALATRPLLAAAETGSDWQPDDAALAQLDGQNRTNIKDTGDGNSIQVRAGGLLVLVGENFHSDPQVYVVRQGDFEEGLITVKKGGAFSKGTLEVKGISSKRALVESALGRISDKKVTFA